VADAIVANRAIANAKNFIGVIREILIGKEL
jgi:hypothetical protein